MKTQHNINGYADELKDIWYLKPGFKILYLKH